MAVALRHPIAAKVDDRANFLRILLNEYPTFLTDWENKTTTEFSKIAKEESGGDKKLKMIYSIHYVLHLIMTMVK